MRSKVRNVLHLYFTIQMSAFADKLPPPIYLILVSFLLMCFLSCEGDYCASDKVFLNHRKVNVILASDTATDRKTTGALHEL